MSEITDADGQPVDVNDLFEWMTIRCRNWEAEPEICGENCGIELPVTSVRSGQWIGVILAQAPEWFVVLRSCTEHARHADPFCSMNCFQRFHARHEHEDDGHDLLARMTRT